MTVMEMLRTARGAGAPAPQEDSGPWLAARRGAGAAGAGALVVLIPTVLAWLASPQSTVSWWDTVAMGLSLWLLVLGAHVDTATATVALAPLLATAAFVLVAVRSAIRVGQSAPEDPRRWLGMDRGLVRAVGCWAGGYAATVAAGSLFAFVGPADPRPLTLVVPVLGAPVLDAGAALAWLVRAGEDGLDLQRRVPGSAVLARAWRPALQGAALMLVLGCLLVVALVLLGRGDVGAVHSALGAGVVGSAVVSFAQLAVLPNLGLWAVSFVAGPGFQVLDGARTTWSGSEGALLPMVPVLGALPQPGAFPGWMPVVVVVPVLVGAVIGWRAIAGMARLSGLLTKVCVVLCAAVLAAVVLGLVNLLAGGRLGVDQLAHVGAPTLALTGMLAAEFAVGAVLVLAWDLWRVRR